jgi:hypothetical protein
VLHRRLGVSKGAAADRIEWAPFILMGNWL